MPVGTGRAHVPHRRPGPLELLGQHRLPRSRRRAGQDPRLSNRTRRSPGSARNPPGRGVRGGRRGGSSGWRKDARRVLHRHRRSEHSLAHARGRTPARVHGAEQLHPGGFLPTDTERQARSTRSARAGVGADGWFGTSRGDRHRTHTHRDLPGRASPVGGRRLLRRRRLLPPGWGQHPVDPGCVAGSTCRRHDQGVRGVHRAEGLGTRPTGRCACRGGIDSRPDRGALVGSVADCGSHGGFTDLWYVRAVRSLRHTRGCRRETRVAGTWPRCRSPRSTARQIGARRARARGAVAVRGDTARRDRRTAGLRDDAAPVVRSAMGRACRRVGRRVRTVDEPAGRCAVEGALGDQRCRGHRATGARHPPSGRGRCVLAHHR